jgi:YidC/Oxa1 family membrane protein insertase
MEQEKRVMIAFALSFACLIVWRVFFMKEPPPPPKISPAAQTKAVSQPPQPPTPAKPTQPVALPVQVGSTPQEIVVESALYKVTFSTQGGVVKSWILSKYKDAKDQPLDVVNVEACTTLGFPMTLRLADPQLTNKLNSANYVATPTGSVKAPVKLQFVYSDGKIQARKQFTLGTGYEVQAEVSVFDGQKYLPLDVSWPGGFGDHSLGAQLEDAASQALYGSPGNLTTVALHKVEGERSIPGPLELAGMEDRYFVSIFLPGSPGQAFRLGRQEWTPPGWQGKDKDKPKPLIVSLVNPLPEPSAFRIFVAPKDLDVLRSVKPPLDSLVNFGWFSFVAKPLFLGLRYIYDRWVHNYGWAIVILTIFINLAMFPLKLKSIRSAQEMQRIAPQVKAIQERYKQYKFNDPRKNRMNQEIMKLYQEHHINPLGGCLPMLLQLPFLYAFYNVLSASIELRHAPWILWIKDLSSPDKFHLLGLPLPILPTLMIVTMFILQKMTPMTTADPAQQRMMMIMPLVFGIMFYNFASGLVLYWLTGNIVGIAQQAFINKMMPPPAPVVVAKKSPAAKG